MNNVSAQIKNINYKTRADGLLEGRLTVNGIRKSFYGKTKVDIKDKFKSYLMKVENGYKEPKKIVLNDYIEYWLKKYKLNKIEPTSYSRMYSVYEHQIKPGLGHKMIGNVTTDDIQALIDFRANPPKGSDVNALALSGLKKIMHLLKPCMAMAVKEGIIFSNPCIDVILPTESCIQVATKEQRSLDDDEIQRFQQAALERYQNGEYKSRDALVLLLVINLGLRVGEVLALEWSDIDFRDRIVNINKTVQSNIKNFENVAGNGKATYSRVKNSAKTKSGKRPLQLNDTVMQYINELRKFDQRNNINSPYVACTRKGLRTSTRNLGRSLDKVISRAGIDWDVSLHTLRHTFGSTLVRRGVQIAVVSKLMGHANITITYNKYIHTIREQEVKTMNMVKVC